MSFRESLDYVERLVKDEEHLAVVLEDALDWAHCFGLVLRTPEHKDRSDYCQTAPLALFPSPFPRKLFEQAMNVQQAMNTLYFRLSWDIPFLIQSHAKVVETDEFTKKLIDILTTVHNEGVRQKITLLTQRADYMCHVEAGQELQLKQIEVNNIAVSMGGLAQRASQLHRRLLNKCRGYDQQTIEANIPANYPIETLAKGVYQAWKSFEDASAIVLVVVEDTNQNQLDQKFVEFELEKLSENKIVCLRLTFTQCANRLTLDENDYSLLVDGGKHRVGIVYFRAGYEPTSYRSEREWQARLMMERSTAIKSPWIGLQLANTKKIQQVLDAAGVVEHYFPGQPQMATDVRSTFAGLWGLENEDKQTASVIQDAINNPHKYVLKPQLEGGAGNYYDEQITAKLKSFTPQQRAAHILMQKITPLVVKNYLIRPFHPPQLVHAVSELGIYGCLLGSGEDMSIAVNTAHGHILRSKGEKVNEGGVAVGAAVIDTPFLI